MEHMKNFTAFVEKEHVRDINVGQSGAWVCEIRGGRIAKLTRRSSLKEDGLWQKYENEAAFYECVKDEALPFVPQVLFIGRQENEILLVMKKYTPIARSALSDAQLCKVWDTLAMIHTTPVPGFLPRGERKPLAYTRAEAEGFIAGWERVLAEHPGAFSADVLHQIGRDINPINIALHSTYKYFTHGDFHFDNLLTDEEGRVVVCDWQGCGAGDPSGDLSFLISRLLSDGYPLDAEKLVEGYCRHANRRGLMLQPQDVHARMALANLNTSFMYWHMYLHGADEARVGSIYEKMTEDYRLLMGRLNP